VIAYFDTSALVPLLVEEPGTELAARMWDSADRVVSVRLARVEARAALAQGARIGRLTARQLASAKRSLDGLLVQLDQIDVDDDLTYRAADLAEAHALRAYDAVHLAASERLGANDGVLVAGDRVLLAAARDRGLLVASLA
jgi:uncharacterized protein